MDLDPGLGGSSRSQRGLERRVGHERLEQLGGLPDVCKHESRGRPGGHVRYNLIAEAS